MIYGIIPARKGSKIIANKNLFEIQGTSLIEFSILAAEKSELKKVIVTTDYEFESMSPFIKNKDKTIYIHRPEEFCNDYSPATAAVDHLIRENILGDDDIVCLLQPTSPIRSHIDINLAILKYLLSGKDTLISVTKGPALKKLYSIDGEKIDVDETGFNKEEDEVTYIRNGSIYIFPIKNYITKRYIFERFPALYLMPSYKSIDIDDMEDMKHTLMLVSGGVLGE